MNDYMEMLSQYPIFDKYLFYSAVRECIGSASDSTLEKLLLSSVKKGTIARIGRNQYCLQHNLRNYHYTYSNKSNHIAQTLNEEFYNPDFRIMELYQLNQFLNHQIAHNVIFIFAEKELCASVFENLKHEYDDMILINPDINTFFNYRTEETIIVKNLITESPKGEEVFWHTELEKLLVDIYSDKLIRSMFSVSEYPLIFETAFKYYAINKTTMFRYAKRRKSDIKIKTYIKNNTDAKLKLDKETFGI